MCGEIWLALFQKAGLLPKGAFVRKLSASGYP